MKKCRGAMGVKRMVLTMSLFSTERDGDESTKNTSAGYNRREISTY